MPYTEHYTTNNMTNTNSTNSTTTSRSTTSNDHYYNNDYISTEPRVLSSEDCERIKEAYLDNISDTMTGAVAYVIESAFKNGLTVDEIIMAIEETGLAPKPSPYYLRAILMNWVENGVLVSRLHHMVRPNAGIPWWKNK